MIFKYAVCTLLLYAVNGFPDVTMEMEFPNLYNESSNCTAPGYICSNCNQLSYCDITEDGTFEEIKIQKCDPFNGEYCNSDLLECSTTPDGKCGSSRRFQCTSVGQFPDIRDCNRYHICVYDKTMNRLVSYDETCAAGFAYDVVTSTCRIQLMNGTCPSYPNLPCVLPIKTAVEKNSAFYYTCTSSETGYVASKVFMCPDNQLFIDDQCQRPPVGIEDGRCTKIGNFYDPNNCNKYKKCASVGGLPETLNCDSFSRFSAHQQVCVRLSCDGLFVN